MKTKNLPGQTPIDQEDLLGLIPDLKTQGELNLAEAQNIQKALLWAARSRKLKSQILTASGLKLLHKKMFEDVWDWAGEFRVKNVTPGVPKEKIQNELGALLGDMTYWIENESFPMEEIAIRFHHRLVFIHPFPNGNGRFSRLAADLRLEFSGEEKFTWSLDSKDSEKKWREKYIEMLRKADRDPKDVAGLLKFARS